MQEKLSRKAVKFACFAELLVFWYLDSLHQLHWNHIYHVYLIYFASQHKQITMRNQISYKGNCHYCNLAFCNSSLPMEHFRLVLLVQILQNLSCKLAVSKCPNLLSALPVRVAACWTRKLTARKLKLIQIFILILQNVRFGLSYPWQCSLFKNLKLYSKETILHYLKSPFLAVIVACLVFAYIVYIFDQLQPYFVNVCLHCCCPTLAKILFPSTELICCNQILFEFWIVLVVRGWCDCLTIFVVVIKFVSCNCNSNNNNNIIN